ncbi:hypothetical protein CRV035 [Nile crocodilepox virus]|uniref:Uncharacterized protein n=1 Tax=Nile crocodilepox virus (isolate Crocodylus niloticus/Zimbabwe/Ume/2001) TaxID=1289473 RepID=Q070L6_CPRVZ|nr:hypothetical protein CRV035 [Nile crocodilepox virus]ABJ08926.1 hypothetical protein CRV035 [Nile crocodilepox virus]
MESGTRKKMGPAQLTIIAVLILAGCKTLTAIKESITLDECYADMFYCRHNYGRRKHDKLDAVVEWLDVVILPVLGGFDIVLGNEERELAAALAEAARNSAQFEVVGGGGPVIPVESGAEIVTEIGVEGPNLGVYVPTGGGASSQSNFIDVLDGIISDFGRNGVQDIDLPPRLQHFLHELSENGESFETLAEDVDVFTPFSMEGPTEMINGGFPDIPPMHEHRMINELLETYRLFLQDRVEFINLDEQLYMSLRELADTSRVDTFYGRMSELTQQMIRHVGRMRNIMSSKLMKEYVQRVGSGNKFPLPKLPTSLADRYLTGADMSEDISSSLSESSPDSDSELNEGVPDVNQQGRDSVIKFMPKDPNDPLEGGSKDVYVSGGQQGADKELTQGLEQEPDIEGKESDYDEYEYDVKVKRRRTESDEDQDFFNAPDEETDTDGELAPDSDHGSESSQGTDDENPGSKSGPSEKSDLFGNSRAHDVNSDRQDRPLCCQVSSHGQHDNNDNNARDPPINGRDRGQHPDGLFEHIGGPRARLIRNLREIEIRAS